MKSKPGSYKLVVAIGACTAVAAGGVAYAASSGAFSAGSYVGTLAGDHGLCQIGRSP